MPEKKSGTIQSQIAGFEELLIKADPSRLDASTYSTAYLAHLLKNIRYYLDIYAEVLERALQKSNKDIASLVLVDYGCGNGLLGLFAKYCGFHKVYLADLDVDFIQAAGSLSDHINIKPDGFISGDENSLLQTLSTKKIDCIVGTDVIEHIYDLADFFKSLHAMNTHMVSVFTTAANVYNPVKRRRLKALQRKDELFGGKPGDDPLFGETAHPAFLEMRKNIIQSYAPLLEPGAVQKLAKNTRGLKKMDIRMAVRIYEENGKLPPRLQHPTNTCHPETGSWTERLLSIGQYRSIYAGAGFSLNIYTGKYDVYKKGIKSFINRILNAGIAVTGKMLAPYLMLVGYQQDFNEPD